jgi:hypothetical protein
MHSRPIAETLDRGFVIVFSWRDFSGLLVG